jgi:hypothetical protein
MAEDRLVTSVLPPGVADLNLRKYFECIMYTFPYLNQDPY